MTERQASRSGERLSSSIWSQLSPERRQQVVFLLAQLVLKLVVGQGDESFQEVCDGSPTQPLQDPS